MKRTLLRIIALVITWMASSAFSQDDWEDALAIGDVSNLTFDTTDATFDGSPHCILGPNIWFCYTASCTGDVTVSLQGSSYDTMLAIYDGCGAPGALSMLKCNDDAPGGGYHSEATFAATAGSEYLIEIGGHDDEAGEGILNISCEEKIPPPNDDWEDAQAIGNVSGLAFDTTDATFDGSPHCILSPNIWFCYTASCTGDVRVSLQGSSYDTMLAIYDGCGAPGALSMLKCNDDAPGGGYHSEATFTATAGSEYLIEIGGYDEDTGQGILTISCEGAIEAEIDIDPDTLNLKNKGKWITCYIELPDGLDAADIDVSTIMLNGEVQAEPRPAKIGDYDSDGVIDLMVKFDRSAVQQILDVGNQVEITIAGELADGTLFEGMDTIRVIEKEKQ